MLINFYIDPALFKIKPAGYLKSFICDLSVVIDYFIWKSNILLNVSMLKLSTVCFFFSSHPDSNTYDLSYIMFVYFIAWTLLNWHIIYMFIIFLFLFSHYNVKFYEGRYFCPFFLTSAS